MSIASAAHCPPEWLELREGADADARADALLVPLRAYLAGHGHPANPPANPRPGPPSGPSANFPVNPPSGPLVVHDLGCGTGSMARWLAGRLPGPQRWVLYDRDPELLARAERAAAVTATRRRDVTRLTADDLADASLVTSSALLDLLTAEEVDRLAEVCAGRPALFTLSVTGRVELTPADPLDDEIAAAFDAHQRRVVAGRRLLGPDAPAVAAEAFRRRGMAVGQHPSPWRLGPAQAALTAEWLTGRVDAAREQCPYLPCEDYLRRRLAACAAGELDVVVYHRDLLALPEATS